MGRQVGQADHSVSKENPVFVHYWKHWITERQTIVCESANPVALSLTRSWPLYAASLWRFIPLFFFLAFSLFFKINSSHLLFNSNPSGIERFSLDWNTADWCLLVPAWPKKKAVGFKLLSHFILVLLMDFFYKTLLVNAPVLYILFWCLECFAKMSRTNGTEFPDRSEKNSLSISGLLPSFSCCLSVCPNRLFLPSNSIPGEKMKWKSCIENTKRLIPVLF